MAEAVEQALQNTKSYPLLLEWLGKHSLKDEAMGEVKHLLQQLAGELLAAGGVSALSSNGHATPGPSEQALYELTDVMFTLPRGKQTVQFFPARMAISSKSTTVNVPYTAIQGVAILDNLATDAKKEKVLLYMALDKAAGVAIGKNVTEAVVIQTSGADISLPAKRSDAFGHLAGPAAVVLCELLGKLCRPKFHSPDPDVFNSSSDSTNICANVKAQSGLLFPLPEALLFVDKPAMFIPLSNVRFIDLQRANGLSATFDVSVHLKDNNVLEFSQIDQKEVNSIRDYMLACNLCEPPDDDAGAVAAGQSDKGKGKAVGPPPSDFPLLGSEDLDDDDEDEDDEDFDPDADDVGPTNRGGSRRGESARGSRAEAASADADEDEDEEEESFQAGEDDDDDDDDEDDGDDEEDDVELVSEDGVGIDPSDIQDLMQEDRSLKRRRTDGGSSGGT